MLLLFSSRHSEATADRHSPPQKLYKLSHLIRERQKRGKNHKIAAKRRTTRKIDM